MQEEREAWRIVSELQEQGIMDSGSRLLAQSRGTTAGRVYMIGEQGVPRYVLKLDDPQSVTRTGELLHAYRHSRLLPRLIYMDPSRTFLVYSYIHGVTHMERGLKRDWLTVLVRELLNQYEAYSEADDGNWGAADEPVSSWRCFISQGVEEAGATLAGLLPPEDLQQVREMAERMPADESWLTRCLLHGDCGVHNFVFDRGELQGVIDPWPVIGPVWYDLVYAFCSSPDDLTPGTLLGAFALLERETVDRRMLIEQTIIQLYCRVGTCVRHHPHDLPAYLQAWESWRSAADGL
ncbi:Phosphotransferase enzyme family protein [Paenibacillus sp. UNCCL117]|uniref:phosphotransferase n=1 Tax=unclassified Paenibacillus TaxID=185978 RepID=UPI00088AA4F8|nr:MULTISPECIES: phosphotransferase [unclassified Paenibacillus]SDE28748.1 Phosphotransferase enzyme family protein [Paenibacillus sp. cl123]SFW63408.1 Phosphotransferase enzyme family protein [Paenibacillus sp. UNCCL117]